MVETSSTGGTLRSGGSGALTDDSRPYSTHDDYKVHAWDTSPRARQIAEERCARALCRKKERNHCWNELRMQPYLRPPWDVFSLCIMPETQCVAQAGGSAYGTAVRIGERVKRWDGAGGRCGGGYGGDWRGAEQLSCGARGAVETDHPGCRSVRRGDAGDWKPVDEAEARV
ncbi:hypothetical protein B0H12DRAFT_158454 [Mycena haematopus]|nr:hypothetical protein B0H12DRAFT_158454 [Mycena haematopus]